MRPAGPEGAGPEAPLGLPVPAGNAGPKPVARAAGPKPLARVAGLKPARPRRPAAATPAAPPMALPTPDPLNAAKAAWQPTMRWCQKEIKESLIDPRVKVAVEQFQTRVQAVLAAPDAERFHAAQLDAAGMARNHQFLRWAPVPSPLPSL